MTIAILVAIAAGILIVVSRNINSLLAEKLGLWLGTFFNYLTGLFFSTLFFLLSGEGIKLAYNQLGAIPFWAYLGGLLGVCVVIISNIVTPKISALYMTLLIFLGQLFTGILVDYFALQLISWGKLIGGLLVMIGLAYNLYIDKKSVPEVQ